MKRAAPTVSPLGRLLELSGLAARAGVSTAVARLAGLGRTAPVKQALRTADLVRSAQRLVSTLGEMKGGAMKLGQMLSLHDPLLPPEVAAVLRSLQKQAPTVPFEVIDGQLVKELGDPARHFAFFEEEAFAAASIGQVHRATLRDGRQVAVKVQYPDIDRIVEADLHNLRRVLKTLVSLVFKVDFQPVWLEMRARLREELDYRHEAANLRRVGDLYAGSSQVLIPRVVPQASTRRVLTMDYVPGLGPDEACSAATPQELKDRWGLVLFDFLLSGLLEHHLLHADPNLANFAFRPDGRVVVYDFGCVKEIPASLAGGYRDLCRTVLRGQLDKIPSVLLAMGLHLSGEPLDDELIGPYLGLVVELLRPSPPYRFGADGTVYGRLFDAALASLDEAADLRFPPDIVFVNRTVVGHLGNLSRLGAAGPWREHMEGFVGKG